jgi:hypothetical protein
MLNDGARFVLASGCEGGVDFAVAVRFQYLHLSPMTAAASTSLVVSSNTDIIGGTAP